ncbi:T9SS type A sorting domain-containing protein [bacterium]|nr:T9SS type A sorting domain-containing protein [bacterium]
MIRCSYILVIFYLLGPKAVYGQGPAGPSLEIDSTAIRLSAGEEVHFDLYIRQQNGEIVHNWDYLGGDTFLELRGSRAEHDSSTHSWNDDADAYSWTRFRLNDSLLTADSIWVKDDVPYQHFTIPRAAFDSGYAALTFSQSRADSGMVLSCSPRWPFLTQDSPPITIRPGPHAGYLVDLTRPFPDSNAVFLLRRFEMLVRPRDRYLNNLPDQEITTRFAARFPGEFDTGFPGISDIWDQDIPITGWMNAFLSPRIAHQLEQNDELQWIEAYDPAHPGRSGRIIFEVINHAPFSFSLLTPIDRSNITLWGPTRTETFTWEDPEPRDPYYQIQTSRFDSLRSSDSVRYKIKFLDAVSLARGRELESDEGGRLPQATITHQWLFDLINFIAGTPTVKEADVVWYVQASDGLFLSKSLPPTNDPRDGFKLTIEKVGDLVAELPEAEHFSLGQNYPNPFAASTTIPLQLKHAGHVRLRVFNLLGEEVARLHDGELTGGTWRFRFIPNHLPPGMYRYVVETEQGRHSRSMLLR